MVDINTIIKLKKFVKKLGQEKDRAEGRVDQQIKTLEEDFKCLNLKQGKELLRKTNQKLNELNIKYESSLKSFMKKWGNVLEENEENNENQL